MDEAFYLPDGDQFISTEHTQGPWDPGFQHAGPPAALVGRAIELCEPRPNAQIARIALEILKPVPIAPLKVRADVVRPGRSVELIEATLHSDNAEVVRARAWRIRTGDFGLNDIGLERPRPPGSHEAPEQNTSGFGYHNAMEWRFVKGDFTEAGPATAWLRMRHPLVAGEQPSSLTRVLVAADSGNGISGNLDFQTHYYINTDLTVQLIMPPAGEWICLDSSTSIAAKGIGLTETLLFDEAGWIGRAAQTLLVGPRQ